MKRERRAYYGVLIFSALVLGCFLFAVALLRQDRSLGGAEDGPKIGVVEIRGIISDSRHALEDLRRFRREETIRAVLVRIDSPGGAVGPSQEIYREIVKTRAKKPVVASMGQVAASGGYYIAAACDKIVASAGTLTGSIGVVANTSEFTSLLQLARINTATFKSGPYKDTGSPLRALTEADRKLLQSMVDRIHAQFVRDVAKGRRLDAKKVKALADGRVLTGEEAKDLKLVDALGNMSDALETAARLAKAKGDPVPVRPPRRGGLLRRLLDPDDVDAMIARIRAELTDAVRIETRNPLLR